MNIDFDLKQLPLNINLETLIKLKVKFNDVPIATELIGQHLKNLHDELSKIGIEAKFELSMPDTPTIKQPNTTPRETHGCGETTVGTQCLYHPRGVCPREQWDCVPCQYRDKPASLEALFLKNYERHVIDYSLRATQCEEGGFNFYIHPLGVDGDTLDFKVRGNTLTKLDLSKE